MKSKTPTYILTLSLKTEKYQEDIINKRLEIARHIQNSLINIVLKRYKLMLDSKVYNKNKKELKQINKLYHNTTSKKEKKLIEKQRKVLYDNKNDIYLKFGLSQYSLYEDVKPMYKHFKDNIGSLEAQAIADKVWVSLDKLLQGESDKIYFKKYGEVNSISNKWNKSGLKYEETGNVIWNDLKIPIIIKNNDLYAQKAIQDRIKFIRIKRILLRDKFKYYVQLVLEGIPPIKFNKETGEIKRYTSNGKVGIDIGTRTIAISSKTEVKLLELCPEVENIERQKKLLQRKVDRQRRTNNHDNYNADGTIKRGVKLIWNKSKRYIKTQNKLRDIQRKQADIRKQSHEKLSNYIMSLGNEFYVETMNYKGLQKKAKKTTINSKGRFNKKKRFGKSLANKAPSMFLTILDNKLKYNGTKLLKINTKEIKASQYNPITDEYKKKELKDRWNIFEYKGKEVRIQRDLMSAFVIMCTNDDLKSTNRELCLNEFEEFKTMHDIEINRIKNCGDKLISSMGI